MAERYVIFLLTRYETNDNDNNNNARVLNINQHNFFTHFSNIFEIAEWIKNGSQFETFDFSPVLK